MKYRPTAASARLLPDAPLLLALLALLSPGAGAQPQGLTALHGAEAAATAPAVVIDNDEHALMLAFGHRDGLTRLAGRVVDRLAADPRHAPLFEQAPPAQLKQRMAEQFCQALQAPCGTGGDAPGNATADAALRRADPEALTALLQDSMHAQAVPAAAQDVLLSRLAPMRQRLVMR